MKLSADYIINHFGEFFTDTFDTFYHNGKEYKNSYWNHVHGEWEGHSTDIKKCVYAIMPYFEYDGKVSCNKVIKGFITEWFPGIEYLIFTAKDIAGPYNKYYGKYVKLNGGDINNIKYLENFMMFDNLNEAKAALKEIIGQNEKSMIENQIKVVKQEMIELNAQLTDKKTEYNELIKKLESL